MDQSCQQGITCSVVSCLSTLDGREDAETGTIRDHVHILRRGQVLRPQIYEGIHRNYASNYRSEENAGQSYDHDLHLSWLRIQSELSALREALEYFWLWTSQRRNIHTQKLTLYV